MPQTFDQLQRTPTQAELIASIVGILKGIGLTTHTGYSPGRVTVTGTPTSNTTLWLRIVTSGDLGAATFDYSFDEGGSWTTPATVPSDGLITLSLTPLVAVMTDGPSGSDSFNVGDIFVVPLSVPIWPLTDWDEGSTGRTLIELDCDALEDLYLLLKDVTAGGFIRLAKGDWVDLLASNVYNLTRIPGTVTEGQVELSDPTSAGPYNLTSGDVVFQSLDGLRFVLSEDVTVAQGGSETAVVRAESKGAQYNVGNGTITLFATAVPGLVVNNPIVANGTWITTAGSNDETNTALILRCLSRWQELAVGLPGPNYDTWARAADAAVNRTFARVSPSVAGQVDLFIAGAGGAVSGGVIANVKAYVDQRVALTNTAVVASVSNYNQTVLAVVYAEAALLEQVQVGITRNLTAFFASKGIGATMYISELYSVLQGTAGVWGEEVLGVRNVVLTTPAGTVALAANEVFVFTNSVTFSGV